MKHFIVRDNYLQIYDEVNTLKSTKEEFLELESTFSLPVNLKQVEYYPGNFYELRHYNGTVESLTPDNAVYDNYITKINTYLELQEELRQQAIKDSLPQTLVEAKLQVEKNIYSYAATLQSRAVNLYSDVERDRWTTIILPEAKAYSVSQEPIDAPNLTTQYTIRTGITNPNLPEFKAGLLAVVNQILQSNEYLVNYANFIAGTRSKWLDVVRSFEQTQMETEKEAITRLLALDWKQGWEMPLN